MGRRLFERVKFIRQITECDSDDGNDNIWHRRPNVKYFDEEFQTEIIEDNIANCDK